jgi:rod shape-determining protein MreD
MGYFGTFRRDPRPILVRHRRAAVRGSPETMRILLAAIGTTLAAVIELSLVPYVSIGGVHPHPVLVLTVIWTIVAGVEPGLVCAFVGGLVLDLLAPRPLGTTAFSLLIAAGGAAGFARALVRVRPLTPVFAVPISSLVYSLVLTGALTLLGTPILAPDPIGPLLPGVVYDGVLGLLVGPLAVSIRDRRVAEERVDW